MPPREAYSIAAVIICRDGGINGGFAVLPSGRCLSQTARNGRAATAKPRPGWPARATHDTTANALRGGLR